MDAPEESDEADDIEEHTVAEGIMRKELKLAKAKKKKVLKGSTLLKGINTKRGWSKPLYHLGKGMGQRMKSKLAKVVSRKAKGTHGDMHPPKFETD